VAASWAAAAGLARQRPARSHQADLGRTVGVDDGDHFVSNDGGAVALDDLDDHASGRCWQFQNHFVGFDIDQVFVARDWFADFLVPGQQGCFSDRFRQLGNFDFDLCHVKLRIFCFAAPPRVARAALRSSS
jgi:hypothetical protein